MRRLRQFFLLLLQPMRAHALRDYNYPIARAALAHAGEKWWCSAWDRENAASARHMRRGTRTSPCTSSSSRARK